MPAKRAQARPQWTPPPTQELLVLERQIRGAIADGEKIKPLPYGEGGWGPWDSNLGDLIDRAFGPDSAQSTSYHWAGGGVFGGSVVDTDYMSAEDIEAAQVKSRNESIVSKIAAAHGVLKAIEQHRLDHRARQQRRSLRCTAGDRAELLVIARGDGAKSLGSDEGEVAAREAWHRRRWLRASTLQFLLDALERKGFTAKQLDDLTFAELVNEAKGAGVIQTRTEKAAHSVRDLRNFVHPAVELREGRLREVDSKAAIALMNMVLEDLA